MTFDSDEIRKIREISSSVASATDGGITFLLIEGLRLPEKCTPKVVNALLCPVLKDGYSSRLYFELIPQGIQPLNWNGNLWLLDKNWHAFSWQTSPGQKLFEMIVEHLNAFNQ